MAAEVCRRKSVWLTPRTFGGNLSEVPRQESSLRRGLGTLGRSCVKWPVSRRFFRPPMSRDIRRDSLSSTCSRRHGAAACQLGSGNPELHREERADDAGKEALFGSAGTGICRPAYARIAPVVIERISTARYRRRRAAMDERRKRGRRRQPTENCQREQCICPPDRQALEEETPRGFERAATPAAGPVPAVVIIRPPCCEDRYCPQLPGEHDRHGWDDERASRSDWSPEGKSQEHETRCYREATSGERTHTATDAQGGHRPGHPPAPVVSRQTVVRLQPNPTLRDGSWSDRSHNGSSPCGAAIGTVVQAWDRRSTARTVDGHHRAPPWAVGTSSAVSLRAI
jgi:hypothetical protein